MWIKFFLLSVFFIINYSIAETHIKGDVSGMFFRNSGNPYIVEKDLIVPHNKTLNIEKGCIFLFKMFTGLNIFGELHVFGHIEDPVIFTSINDKRYNLNAKKAPEPFDWNGIFFSKESKMIYLSGFFLSYSVYGIKSENPVFIIKNGVFKNNGQYNLTINDRFVLIDDDFHFFHFPGDKVVSKPIHYENKGIKKIKFFVKKTTYNSGTLSLAVGISSLTLLKLWNDGRKKFEKTTDIKTQDKLLKKGLLYSSGAAITGAISISILVYHINKKLSPKERTFLDNK